MDGFYKLVSNRFARRDPKVKYVLGFIAAVAVVLCIVYMNSFVVSESEYAILTQFGKPVATIKTAGFNWRWMGFVQRANRIDRRSHTFTTQPIQLLLGDKNPIVLTCYICWQVSDPLLFSQSLISSDIATQKLGDMVNSQIGNALGDFKIGNIINTNFSDVKLGVLEEQILKNTNSSAQNNYGIEVIQVGIRRIAYPAVVAQAVYNRMRSEREKEAIKFRAEGREEATKVRAGADRESAEILAEAYRQAEILKGEGDRKALKIYAGAYGMDNEFFEFVKSMEVYKDILGSQSTLVLSADSEIFKYFNNPEGRK